MKLIITLFPHCPATSLFSSKYYPQLFVVRFSLAVAMLIASNDGAQKQKNLH